eukprot:3564727-Lingulodinium_polyedra.AAC.1
MFARTGALTLPLPRRGHGPPPSHCRPRRAPAPRNVNPPSQLGLGGGRVLQQPTNGVARCG